MGNFMGREERHENAPLAANLAGHRAVAPENIVFQEPSKYATRYTPEDRRRGLALLEDGISSRVAAVQIAPGCCHSTVLKWKNKQVKARLKELRQRQLERQRRQLVWREQAAKRARDRQLIEERRRWREHARDGANIEDGNLERAENVDEMERENEGENGVEILEVHEPRNDAEDDNPEEDVNVEVEEEDQVAENIDEAMPEEENQVALEE